MEEFRLKEKYNVDDFRRLMAYLRSEKGCPWDREQTHESIRRNMLEEAYEAVEAIDEGSREHLIEELGDVLMQVLFHARMEEEKGSFDIDDVADAACKKLVLRHPHVFGEVKVSGSDEVLTNWDAIKRVEKSQETVTDSLNAVARSLPGLWRAEKIQKKAAKAGFDWPDVEGALLKLEEEVRELREAVENGGDRARDELGDVIFSAVNVARFIKKDPEEAVHGTCEKFIRRFSYIEEAAAEAGRELGKMTLEEMDELYERGKKLEN